MGTSREQRTDHETGPGSSGSSTTSSSPDGGHGNQAALQDMEGGGGPRGGGTYIVQRGDTLWGIARQAYGQGSLYTHIRDANPDKVFDNGNLIFTGSELSIPSLTPEGAEGDTGPDTAALESRFEATTYGLYEVWPDEAPITLLPAARSDTVIQIKEADFQRLQTQMAAIESGLSAVVVTGSDTFQAALLSDLAWLQSQSIGGELIAELEASGYTVTIAETSGGNSAGYNPDSDSWEQADGTPGAGANVNINYNPVEWNPYGGTEDWQTRPPAIGLAHEMVHAWTGVYGTRALGNDADGTRRRELQATGLGEFSDAQFSENRFRAAFGLPQRPEY